MASVSENAAANQTIDQLEDLRRALVNGSLLAAAQRNGTTSAQELTAAARAEYGRLLGILYENGRYGAVINITIAYFGGAAR